MTITTSSQPCSAPLRIPPPTFPLPGAELVEAAEGRAKVRFVPRHDTTIPADLVQGGILTACLNDVMGSAVSSLGRDGFFVTVSFLGKAEPGRTLVAAGVLTPHVGLEAALERAADAHAAMESRTTMGKIVLSVGAVEGNEDHAAKHVTGRAR